MFMFVGVSGVDPEGAQTSIYISGEPGDDLGELIEQAKAQADDLGIKYTGVGTLPVPPGLMKPNDQGEVEVKEVGCLIRRKQRNTGKDGTVTTSPAIVLYPPWNSVGSYGKYSLTTVYLDKPEQVADFEEFMKLAGVGEKLEDIPLYPGQGAPQRVFNYKEEQEIILERPIKLAFSVRHKKEGDGTYYRLVDWLPK